MNVMTGLGQPSSPTLSSASGPGSVSQRSANTANPLAGCINLDRIRFDDRGLVAAVAQDYLDGTILMLAWMNRQAIEQTLATGEAHYWSRSRQELWHKGATSGHIQKVKTLRYDCDGDAILLSINQIGDIACHTGQRSCFHQIDHPDRPDHTDQPSHRSSDLASHSASDSAQPTIDPSLEPPAEPIVTHQILPPPADTLSQVFAVICDRRDRPNPESYTCKLLAGGDNKILKKIGEEAAEVVMACKDDDPEQMIGEAADLIFHLMVALAHHKVELKDVYRKLQERRR